MNKGNVTKIAIGQCRVSKGSREEIENSLRSQQTEIIKFAKKKLNISEDEIEWCIEEEARSSYDESADWSYFDSAIDKAKSTESIKYFISYSQDRFCRNSMKSKMYKQLLLQDGVRVRFVHGDVENPDSDSGFVQDNMQEMLSEWYSRKIANETLRGCKQNAQTRDVETGYVYQNGGSAPFWLMPSKIQIGVDKYNKSIEKTIWVKNDTIYIATMNGKTVSKSMWDWGKYIFLELRLKQGKSYNEIAEIANELGLPLARNSKLVRDNTLSLQAKNENIYGVSVYNKRHYNNNHKKGSLKSESEWVIVDNAMPALITKEQYNLLQELSKKKARKVGSTSANTKTNTKLLVNIPNKFYCTNCGAKIVSTGKHYVCSNYNNHGKQGCGASSFHVNSEWLDTKIEKEIIRLMLNDKVIETLYEQYTHKYGSKVDIGGNNDIDKSALVKELKKKKQKEANLINTIDSGKLEEAALNAIYNRLNVVSAEKKALEIQIDKFNKPQQYRILTYDYFKQMCHEGSRLLTHSSLAEKRAFVEKCLESVTLDPVRKQVNAKFKINPFWSSLENHSKAKKLEVSEFDTSSEMVAGAGFEPTTFGL